MRIGLVSRYFPPTVRGGSHLSVYYLARGLAEHGHEVHVFTSPPPDGGAGEAEADRWPHPGVLLHPVFSRARPRMLWDMDAASWIMGWRLRHYLPRRGLRLDVLHAYGMDTIPAVVMARRHGQPVATFNGYWATCPFWDHTDPASRKVNTVCAYRHLGHCIAARDAHRSFLRRWAKRVLLAVSLRCRQHYARRLALWLPISASMQALLKAQGFPPRPMPVCYSMIDPGEYRGLDGSYLERRHGIPPSRRILLYSGRLAPYKGGEVILRAAPAILARHPDVHFVFVGHGSTLPELKALARSQGVEDNVTFGNFVSPREMPHVYASAWALLHTATWPEPFARAPMEALAAGTAVVATDTGGTPEVVVHEETGLLVPPFDAEALASACCRLLEDPQLRHRLAAVGQAQVRRRFSIEAQIPAYIAAYESVL